jgi:hypothetical protein
MRLSNESLLVIILVRLIAGWLTGQAMRGSGFGLIDDLIVGSWLVGRSPWRLASATTKDPSRCHY